MTEIFEVEIILASYNAGAGHVEDAQRLTEKYGGNPQVWDDVSYWLLQKSTQQYSSDEVVKFGFCRGLEPVNYVSQHPRTLRPLQTVRGDVNSKI